MAEGVQEIGKRLWHWKECQDCQDDLKAFWPREQPREPAVGQGWYDEASNCLCVWDGSEWACVPAD